MSQVVPGLAKVSQDRFSHEHTVGMGIVVWDSLFCQRKKMFVLTETSRKVLNLTNKWQFKEETLFPELGGEGRGASLDHHMQCLTVHVTEQKFLKWPEDIQDWSHVRQTPALLLQNLIASKQPYNCVSSCCCWLLIRTSDLKHLDPSFSGSKPSLNFETVIVLSFRLSLGSSASWRALCFWISLRWSSISSWSWAFRNLKTSSAFTYKFVHVAYIFSLGQKPYVHSDISQRMMVFTLSVTNALKWKEYEDVDNPSCYHHFWESNYLANQGILVLQVLYVKIMWYYMFFLAYIGRTVHHSFLQGSLHLITCQSGTMEYIWIMLWVMKQKNVHL